MDRLTRSLCELIDIESVTGDERAIRDHLAEHLARLGLDVDSFDADLDEIRSDPAYPGMEVERTSLPTLIATLNQRAPGAHPLLTGHIDVVPAGEPSTWTSDPFVGRVDGDTVFGRGACDMKAGVAVILDVVERLIEADHHGPVSVALVPSEEDGGAGSLAAIRRGITADFAVIPEPTNLEIVTAHAGAITFRLVIPGRAAHAAIRTEGISALDGLATIIDALERDEERRNQTATDPRMAALGLPYPTIIGQISGGAWASTVMDTVEIRGRYGVALGQTWQEAAAELERALETAWTADPFLSDHPMEFEIYGATFDSCGIADDDPLVLSLGASVRAITGVTAVPVGLPAGTDMRLFVNEASMPTVLFGPGDLRHAHAADERVSREQVRQCADVLTHWIQHLE